MIYEMSLCQAVCKACINNINLCFREEPSMRAPKEKRLRIKYGNLRRTIKKTSLRPSS